jgi:hypothetical protein
MDGSSIGPTPRRVVEAAREHRLGGPVTTAAAHRLSPARILLGAGLWVVCWMAASLLLVVVRPPGWLAVPAVVLSVLLGLYAAGRRLTCGGTLHLYERGAVIDHPRRPVVALAWAHLLPCEHRKRLALGGGHRALTVRIGPRAVFTCTQEIADRLADVIAAMELPRARSVLATGGTLDYGAVQVTPDALVVERHTLPWAAVTGMQVDGPHLWIFSWSGAPVPLLRAGVAHQRTLMLLGAHLADAARRI